MRRKEIVGLHVLPVETKRRRSNQMPLYLADDAQLVAHVCGVIVWLDLVDRCRAHADFEEWMSRFVEHLTAFMCEYGVAHGSARREYELHRASLETGAVALSTFLAETQMSAELPPTAFAASGEEAIARAIDVTSSVSAKRPESSSIAEFYEIERTAEIIRKGDYKRVRPSIPVLDR